MVLKRLVGLLPEKWINEIRRLRFAVQISRGTFTGDEPEYFQLRDWVNEGDWVLDVGANIGRYTKRLSEIVGPSGRVIAFEPIPETFAILASNVSLLQHKNVTLVNAACSDACSTLQMQIPSFDTGLRNYYEARISDRDAGSADIQSVNILSLVPDVMRFPCPISFIKIDAEGHEAYVLAGLKQVIRRDLPIVIVETNSDDVIQTMEELGFVSTVLPASPNTIYVPRGEGIGKRQGTSSVLETDSGPRIEAATAMDIAGGDAIG